MTRQPGSFGVGLVGAGAVTQAIHLPTLSRVADRLYVAHITDIDLALAQTLADRTGATASQSFDALLTDPKVDIVAICSPHRFHASQIEAACRAGKKAILCEKPLAVAPEELNRIEVVSAETGVPIVVGAMLAYDPAWRAGLKAWSDLGLTTRHVKSTIYLPANTEMIRLATDPLESATPPSGPDRRTAEGRRQLIRNGILGLATHALPQLHALVPGLETVTDVRLLDPWGYSVSLSDEVATAQLFAVMPGQWDPDWRLEAWAAGHRLVLESPPAFVSAGSSRVRLIGPEHTREWQSPINGYEAEWRHLADLATGGVEPLVALSTALSELRIGLRIIDAADRQGEAA